MKSFYNFLFIFVLGFLIGALWYRLQLFPIPNLKHIKAHRTSIVFYSAGDPVFIDRDYYDQSFNSKLDNMYLIKLTRHRNSSDNIKLKVKYPVTIYRILSDSNENNFLHKYEPTKIKVKVVGNTSSHTKVVKKDFLPGLVELSPGKGLSSSPIFVSHALDFRDHKKVFEVLDSFYSFSK